MTVESLESNVKETTVVQKIKKESVESGIMQTIDPTETVVIEKIADKTFEPAEKEAETIDSTETATIEQTANQTVVSAEKEAESVADEEIKSKQQDVNQEKVTGKRHKKS